MPGSATRPASRRTVLRTGAWGLGALGATALAGCSSGNDNEIQLWHFYAPEDPVYTDWLLPLVKDWNANHKVRIHERFIPFTDYGNGPALSTSFTAGTGPDVFLLSPGDFTRYYNGGVLTDLTDYIPQSVREDFDPLPLESRTFDGRIHGLPMESEPLALYYSKQAFEEAKLSEADVPDTWDKLLDVAQKLSKPDRFGLALDTNPGYYQNFTWYPFMWMGDGSPVSKDQRSSTFDSKATVDALRLWQDTIDLGVSPTKIRGTGGMDTESNLRAGYCAMQQTGIWMIAESARDTPDFEYGVVPLPTPPGGKQVTCAGGWAFVANAKGRNPEAAAEFVVFALGSDDDTCIERARKLNTEIKSNVPVRKSVRKKAEEAGAFTGAYKQFVEEIAPTAVGEPRYPVEVYRAISDALQACQLDGLNVEDAAADADAQIQTFLSGYDGGSIL